VLPRAGSATVYGAAMKVALTGGIGAGKSTVAGMLAEHGACIVDADAISREVVAPGTAGLDAVRAEFGDGVIAQDGSLDRQVLAGIVFSDPARRAALEAIVHPLVAERSADLIETALATDPDCCVVHDVPLLAELVGRGSRSLEGYDGVIVVEAPVELRIERLVERGLPRWDAEARIASQATDDERRALASHVIVNDAGIEQLRARVAEIVADLACRPTA
jgi:dephospho-CoA kinase